MNTHTQSQGGRASRAKSLIIEKVSPPQETIRDGTETDLVEYLYRLEKLTGLEPLGLTTHDRQKLDRAREQVADELEKRWANRTNRSKKAKETEEQEYEKDVDNEAKKIGFTFNKEIQLIKTEEERYVLGIALEPNDGSESTPLDPDSQKDIYSEGEIRKTGHLFLSNYQNIGLMHTVILKDKVQIVESYLAPVGFWISRDGKTKEGQKGQNKPEGLWQYVRKGTWLLGLKILDNLLWKEIKEDKLTGLSVGGRATRVPA